MNLDQCYQANQGKVVSFDGDPANAGQCLQWVSIVNRDVYNAPPFYTPGAIDWFQKFAGSPLESHYDRLTDGSVRKGDIVVFNTLVGSQYGHIDVAMADGSYDSFQGADSNWGGNLTVHLVTHANRSYVLGVLRIKQGEPMADDNITTLEYGARLGRNPNQAELDSWRGRPTNLLITSLATSDEGHAYYAKVKAALDGTAVGYVPVTETLYRKK